MDWLVDGIRSEARGDHRKVTLPAQRIGYRLYIAAYGLDIFTNLFVLTAFSKFEIPREFTVSARLQRWIRGNYIRRTAFAVWAADNLIDPFYWEPGKPHQARQLDHAADRKSAHCGEVFFYKDKHGRTCGIHGRHCDLNALITLTDLVLQTVVPVSGLHFAAATRIGYGTPKIQKR